MVAERSNLGKLIVAQATPGDGEKIVVWPRDGGIVGLWVCRTGGPWAPSGVSAGSHLKDFAAGGHKTRPYDGPKTQPAWFFVAVVVVVVGLLFAIVVAVVIVICRIRLLLLVLVLVLLLVLEPSIGGVDYDCDHDDDHGGRRGIGSVVPIGLLVEESTTTTTTMATRTTERLAVRRWFGSSGAVEKA